MSLLFKNTRCLNKITEEARLIFNANKDFYQIFKKKDKDIYKDIILMIMDSRTEMYCTKSVFLNGQLIGIINFYDAVELPIRQMFGLNYLRLNSKIKNQDIQNFSVNLPNIEEKSMYLSRICLVKEERGKGYATYFLKYYENIAIKKKYSYLSLHVHKDNKAALILYKRHGFYVDDTSNSYLKLLKKI